MAQDAKRRNWQHGEHAADPAPEAAVSRPPPLWDHISHLGVAALARAALEGPLHHYPLLLFIPAVFLSSLMFDKGSGFFATAASAMLAAFFFIPPRFSFAIGWGQALAVSIYVVIGFTMAATTEALRKTVGRLEKAERTKALLLEELAHRTRNDLALVSSALSLQARSQSDPVVRTALDAAAARVHVIAQAQERLQGNDQVGAVDLQPYLQALCGGLGDLLRDVRPIAVRLGCEPMRLNSSQAVAVGLIVNELVTNAFKYAFPAEHGGAIDVDVTTLADDRLRIVVRDDGVGCPADCGAGLGTRLVRLLAEQHNGRVWREGADPGCRAVVEIAFEK